MVEGVKGEWRVEPSLLDGRFEGRAALLSPFDRLVQDRKRMTEIFEFEYFLEMYKPVAKRRWGYYALPILYGDRLVGKLDATADHAEGVLRVDAVHEDEPFDPATAPPSTPRSRTSPAGSGSTCTGLSDPGCFRAGVRGMSRSPAGRANAVHSSWVATPDK